MYFDAAITFHMTIEADSEQDAYDQVINEGLDELENQGITIDMIKLTKFS